MKLSRQIEERMHLTRAKLWAETYRIGIQNNMSEKETSPAYKSEMANFYADNAVKSFDSKFMVEKKPEQKLAA